jgi:hypothetical protein
VCWCLARGSLLCVAVIALILSGTGCESLSPQGEALL